MRLSRHKTFTDFAPGFLHVDIKYLPQMADEIARHNLFVAIDRATRWVYVRIYADQSEMSNTHFLCRLHATAPMKIDKLPTDNDSQFTDRCTAKRKQPSGDRALDRECAKLDIGHRLIKPRHPQPTAWWSASMAASVTSWRPRASARGPANQDRTLCEPL